MVGLLSLMVLPCAAALAKPAVKPKTHATVIHPRFQLVASNFGVLTRGDVDNPGVPHNVIGGRYVLLDGWSRQVLIDERTGKRVDVTATGCRLQLVGEPWAIAWCPPRTLPPTASSQRMLYNLATGARRPLQYSPDIQRWMADPLLGAIPEAIGKFWIEVDETCAQLTGCEHFYVFQNVQTGQVRVLPRDSRVTANLDSPSLVEKLCRPLRVLGTFPASLALDGRFAIVSRGPPTYLERCGSQLRMPIGDPAAFLSADQTVANAHVVLWLSGYTRTGERFTGVLLPSLKRVTFSFPSHLLPDRVAYALDERRFYVVDQRGRVWAAQIPTR
jgi:hypothetical protein